MKKTTANPSRTPASGRIPAIFAPRSPTSSMPCMDQVVGRTLTIVWTAAGNRSSGYQQPPSRAINIPNMIDSPLAWFSFFTKAPSMVPRAAAAMAEATIISASWELNIFRLVDNVLEGKKKESLDLLWNLFKKGVKPSVLLVKIADQLQKIVRAKELPAGISAEEGKGQLGIKSKSNFPYEKTIRQARAYSLERIKAVYRLLLDYDLGVKSGRYEEETGLEVLVTEIGMMSQEKSPVPSFK